MKIEIGESLIYSWLRHVKECQIVQNNWKASRSWKSNNITAANQIFDDLKIEFANIGLDVFKKNSFTMFLEQAECDSVGIYFGGNEIVYYAVDVAFHSTTLNYSNGTTVQKVTEKFIRQALCMLVYLDSKDANIVFAAPIAGNKVVKAINSNLQIIRNYFSQNGYNYSFEFIVNDEFNLKILNPVIAAASDVEDTTELFIRSIKLYNNLNSKLSKKTKPLKNKNVSTGNQIDLSSVNLDVFKVGKIANVFLRYLLETKKFSISEIQEMQDLNFSKNTFGLNFPLLVDSNCNDLNRYYSKPVIINGVSYYLCSQWFETKNNNDKPLLIEWINKNKD